MKKLLSAVVLAGIITFSGTAGAGMMGSGSGWMMGGWTGMMGGSGPFSSVNGSFGMMNGMAGSPVVGDDGTAYLVTYDTTASQGTVPSSSVFQSKLIAIDTSGKVNSLTLNGIISRPVLSEGYLFATSSMSNMANYMIVGDFRDYQAFGQSVVYAVPTNFNSSTQPAALALDGNFASVPVVSNKRLYIVASDFGNAMMTGNNTFNMMYGNYNFNGTGTAKTYMYIFNLDGTLVSKTLIQ